MVNPRGLNLSVLYALVHESALLMTGHTSERVQAVTSMRKVHRRAALATFMFEIITRRLFISGDRVPGKMDTIGGSM